LSHHLGLISPAHLSWVSCIIVIASHFHPSHKNFQISRDHLSQLIFINSAGFLLLLLLMVSFLNKTFSIQLKKLRVPKFHTDGFLQYRNILGTYLAHGVSYWLIMLIISYMRNSAKNGLSLMWKPYDDPYKRASYTLLKSSNNST